MRKNNQKINFDIAKEYVIGVDGGGTKTVGILADINEKILKRIEIGPTNPNKVGFEKAFLDLKNLLSKITSGFSETKIKLAYLGIGGVKRDIEKKQKLQKFLNKEFSFPIKIEGDQKIAFRSGTDKKEGIVIIAGTGSICIGWYGRKEVSCGGMDWLLGDQGSAFWVGKKTLEEIIKSIDGRRKPLPKLTRLLLKQYRI